MFLSRYYTFFIIVVYKTNNRKTFFLNILFLFYFLISIQFETVLIKFSSTQDLVLTSRKIYSKFSTEFHPKRVENFIR